MKIGQLVEIPVRSERAPIIGRVGRGVVVGFTRGLIVVEWRDGLRACYYRDQIGPNGSFRAGQRWPIRDHVRAEAA